MADALAVKQVHDALRSYLRTRPDIGAVKAVLDRVLESRNPFAEKAARAPQRWFVLFSLLAALALGCFLYFANLQ